MLVYNLFYTLLSPFGLENILLLPNEMFSYMENVTEWYQLLDINYIYSFIIYFAFAWLMFFVFCVVPFRFFVWLIKLPKRRN